MQTETPTYDANKKARIAASEVSTKTRTNTKVTQYFYRPDLMRKTRQRVDPCLRAVCESRDSVHSDAGIHCIVPTLHDWEIHIWFTVTMHITLLARRNKMRVCVTKLFSCSAPHSHPHVHTQGKHASFSRNAKDTLLSWPTNCAIILNHVNTPHYHTFLSFFTHSDLFLSLGPIQEGVWEEKSTVWLQHAPRHRESSIEAAQICWHYPQWCRCLKSPVQKVYFSSVTKDRPFAFSGKLNYKILGGCLIIA